MSTTPDNRELLALVRAWAAANYPGCPLQSITIQLGNLAESIRGRRMTAAIGAASVVFTRPLLSLPLSSLSGLGHAP